MSGEILSLIDVERRQLRSGSSYTEFVLEAGSGEADRLVTFCRVSEDCVDELIQQQRARADRLGYALEWKVYGHDTPHDLVERLVAAGFEAEPVEQVMALQVDRLSFAAFPESATAVIKRIEQVAELEAVAEISREIGRTRVDEERARLAAALAGDPLSVSVYVAYLDGEPAACGRLHVATTRSFGELCGGRTKTKFRSRGLYLALVRARLMEAAQRKLAYVTVDALPTSQPLLEKRGFAAVTWTRPLRYEPLGTSSEPE